MKPVSLLVAVAPSKDGKEYLALSVTGASELVFFLNEIFFCFYFSWEFGVARKVFDALAAKDFGKELFETFLYILKQV